MPQLNKGLPISSSVGTLTGDDVRLMVVDDQRLRYRGSDSVDWYGGSEAIE